MNLIDKTKVENLAAGGKFSLEDIPVKKFYDQAQYLENVLLPAIEKKSGKESTDYKYFSEVFRSLLYAVLLRDRENRLISKIQQTNQINLILSKRLEFCEGELLKYSTMEDLYLTEAKDHIAAGVLSKVNDFFNRTNK